jgi:murein DD-endopeptidase MepM/ murein hydrolase activator NlpD
MVTSSEITRPLTERSRTLRRSVATVAAITAVVTTFGAGIGVGVAEAAPGVPSAPQPAPATATGALDADDAIACPIPSGSDFIDSWGASRSGGRRHEGVDMIANRGTPVVAAQSGDVNFKQNSLGGNAAWLRSPSGNTFYYAHFDSFEGASRNVVQGEVIGYVGSTGNAQGPHLHFETHFNGSVGNPYNATYAACVQPGIDALIALAEANAEYAAIHGEFKVTARTAAAKTGAGVAGGTIIRH